MKKSEMAKIITRAMKGKNLSTSIQYCKCPVCGKYILFSVKTLTFNCPYCKVEGDWYDITKKGMKPQGDFSYDAVQIKIAKKYFPNELENIKKAQDLRKKEKEFLYKINEEAYEIFKETLTKNKEATKYLDKRGFDSAIREEFGIGLAPAYNYLYKRLKEKYTEEEMLEAGLINYSEKTNKYYDTFRDRIMYSIKDKNGNIVGFSGRIYKPSETYAKYVNTKATKVFIKNKILYNLNNLNKDKFVFVAEGFNDVITMKKHGINNVVCVMGTAFTESHYELLKEYAKHIVLLFDGDSAGKKAAGKTIKKFGKSDIKICILPEGKDPDEFINEKGVAEFKDYINKNILKWEEYIVLSSKEATT